MARQIVFRGRKIQLALDSRPAGRPDHPARRGAPSRGRRHPAAAGRGPRLSAAQSPARVGEMLWEIPAGTLEPGEAIESAAVRELAEETGYRAGRWRKLAAVLPVPGHPERAHAPLPGRGADAGAMRPETDERIEPQVVPWDEATWLGAGRHHPRRQDAGRLAPLGSAAASAARKLNRAPDRYQG